MHIPHIRFLLIHALGGVGAGLAATALLVWLDVAQLGSLAAASPDGGIAIALLGFGFAVTFGSAAIGAAIMGEARRDDPPAPPRAGDPVRALHAVLVMLPLRAARRR